MKIIETKHVLIVEDSADHRMLLKTILESKGYTAECTANGAEALSLLQNSEKLPNVILLDMRMPVMDGATFRKRQSEDPDLMNIPVIVMSGENDLKKTRDKLDVEVLQKPVTIKAMMEVIERSTLLH